MNRISLISTPSLSRPSACRRAGPAELRSSSTPIVVDSRLYQQESPPVKTYPHPSIDSPACLTENRLLVLKDSQLVREVLLSFWKIHILHHAAEGLVYGQWMIGELRRHGYEISPGTMYPLLRRMESQGWLKPVRTSPANRSRRKEYTLTRLGGQALDLLRTQLAELHREVFEKHKKGRGHHRPG